jgi:hypothetical protein
MLGVGRVEGVAGHAVQAAAPPVGRLGPAPYELSSWSWYRVGVPLCQGSTRPKRTSSP